MPRRSHPQSIEELEQDDMVYGPSERREEHRMLVELSKRYLLSAADHIESSRALVAKIQATFARRRSG
jgi:hypothetical protein